MDRMRNQNWVKKKKDKSESIYMRYTDKLKVCVQQIYIWV